VTDGVTRLAAANGVSTPGSATRIHRTGRMGESGPSPGPCAAAALVRVFGVALEATVEQPVADADPART
jgi:hypothetical protein